MTALVGVVYIRDSRVSGTCMRVQLVSLQTCIELGLVQETVQAGMSDFPCMFVIMQVHTALVVSCFYMVFNFGGIPGIRGQCLVSDAGEILITVSLIVAYELI